MTNLNKALCNFLSLLQFRFSKVFHHFDSGSAMHLSFAPSVQVLVSLWKLGPRMRSPAWFRSASSVLCSSLQFVWRLHQNIWIRGACAQLSRVSQWLHAGASFAVTHVAPLPEGLSPDCEEPSAQRVPPTKNLGYDKDLVSLLPELHK